MPSWPVFWWLTSLQLQSLRLPSSRLPSLRPVCGQCLRGQHLWGRCLCSKVLWGRHPLGLRLCGRHLQTGVFAAGVFVACVFAAGIFVIKILAAKIPATKTPASKSLAAKTLAAKTKYDDIKIVSSFWTVIGIKTSRFVKNDQIYWKEIFTAVTLLKHIEHSDDWFSWYNNQLVISKIFNFKKLYLRIFKKEQKYTSKRSQKIRKYNLK